MVLRKLKDNGLTINGSKCEFGVEELDFLAHQISSNGMKPPTARVQHILDIPQPTNILELRRFVGIINYYRKYIPNAAEFLAPLCELFKDSKKNDKRKVEWNSVLQQAFEKSKQAIANQALLHFPDASSPMALKTDASDTAVGAHLDIKRDGEWKTIAFFSSKLKTAQRNYSVYDRELLAIYLAIKHFQQILDGRKFIIMTDHKPLIYAFQQDSNKASPRQIRHLSFIAQFSTNIVHVSGTENQLADALSRIYTLNMPTTISLHEIQQEQEIDHELQEILNSNTSLRLQKLYLQDNVNVFCNTSTDRIRPYIPESLRWKIFNIFHSSSHPGNRSTSKQIRQKYVWPSMNSDVAKWVRQCENCQRAKVNKHNQLIPQKFREVDQRFQHVHIDIIVMREVKGYRYCLTMIDRFTRWPEIVPLKDITTDTVTTSFYAAWICRFGAPQTVTTDQGSQFEADFFKSILSLVGARRIGTTTYHPASNGMIERWHRSLKTALMCNTHTPWIEVIPTVLLGLRTCIKEDIGLSAAEILYGTTLTLPGEYFLTDNETTDPMQFTTKFREYIRQIKPSPAAIHSNSKLFINKGMEDCSHVWIRNDHVKKPLEPPYAGPYKVVQRLNDRIYSVEINGKIQNISVERLKPAFSARDDNVQVKPAKTYSKKITFALGGE